MLSYQHEYHAGNHADVLKHVCLCSILDSLCRKEKPFTIIDSHAGAGGDGGEHDVDALVEQVVVGVDAELAVTLVIAGQDLELDIAALRVDLISGDLRAVLNGQAVHGVRTGHRADDANLDRVSHRQRSGRHEDERQSDCENLLHKPLPLYSGVCPV